MAKKKPTRKSFASRLPAARSAYGRLVADISQLLEMARREAARTVNRLLTATFWDIGRRLVEFEQGGNARAEYVKRCSNAWRRT
jgi:hypothetical protein